MLSFIHNLIKSPNPFGFQKVWCKLPLEIKGLPVRVTLAGHIGKPVWVVVARHYRNGWEPFDYQRFSALKPARKMNTFEYPEDREFFISLLNSSEEKFDEEYGDLFDFRHQAIKRWEYDKSSKKILDDLLEKYGEVCQLQLHPDCSKEKVWQVDHIIPLASNELNKKLRNIERDGSEKVPAQSFGSNHPRNLTLACKRCNAFKKHRLILPKNFH